MNSFASPWPMKTDGFTLMELLVVMFILAGVLITASSMFVTGLKMQGVLIDQTDAQADANFLMAHISRNFPLAVSLSRPASVGGTDTWLYFTFDDDWTPSDTTDDDEYQYQYVSGNNTLRFRTDFAPGGVSVWATLSDQITSFTVVRPESNRVEVTFTTDVDGEQLILDSQFTSRAMRAN